MRTLLTLLLIAVFTVQSLYAQTFRLIDFKPTKIGEEASFQLFYKGPAIDLTFSHQLPPGIAVQFMKLPAVPNSLAATIKFTPTQRASPGRYQFSFLARNAAGETLAQLDTLFQVLEGNHRPVLQGGPLEFVIGPDKRSEMVFTLKDPDQDSLVCRIVRLTRPGEVAPPSPIAINVTPVNLAAGTFKLAIATPNTIPIGGTFSYQLLVDKYRRGTIRVAPTSHPIVIEVSATNLPPKFDLPPDRTFSFVEGKKATLTLLAADPNQDIARYTVVLEPSTLLSPASLTSTNGVFEWEMPFTTVPGNNFMSVLKARCMVLDRNGISDTLTLRIKVANVLQEGELISARQVHTTLQTGGQQELKGLAELLGRAEKLRKRDKVFTFASLLTGVATGTLAGLETTNSNIADSNARPYMLLGFGAATAIFEAVKLIWPYPEKETSERKLKQEKLEEVLNDFNRTYPAPTSEQIVSKTYQDSMEKLKQAILQARS